VSLTRLVILGGVRTFQPVHGYVLRRELLSWSADRWASLNPGSVYNALRSLTRDGLLEELEGEPVGGKPGRTTYRLTDEGDSEFLTLLRDALWNVAPFEPGRLLAAISFGWALSREEVLAALAHRAAQLEAAHASVDFQVQSVLQHAGKPAHVAEFFHLTDAWQQGELAWVRAFAARVDEGAYTFAGEEWPEPQRHEWARMLDRKR
jgi:DNA-binding PadR family transcriptional regulator